MMQNKALPAYIALGIGILSLSFSAMFVRWADAPGPVTAFYRLFLSVFLLLPFFLPKLKTNPSIRTRVALFPTPPPPMQRCWETLPPYGLRWERG